MSKIFGFDPIVDENSVVLILGSMPSVRSLEKAEYYAHPQNRFWRVVFELTGETETSDYEEKKKILLRHGIALWDTVGTCVREGSADSAIREIEANDIRGLLRSYPKIKAVFTNGKKSEEVFKRHFPDLKFNYLPSTSPANAAFSYKNLYRIWEKSLKDSII